MSSACATKPASLHLAVTRVSKCSCKRKIRAVQLQCALHKDMLLAISCNLGGQQELPI